MRFRSVILLIVCVLAALPFAHGQGADWFAVPLRLSWDLSMAGFCTNETQCLLHIQGNPAYDGDIRRWYELSQPSNWPKCVNNSQYILDFKCENGNWTTRTKYLALQLLAFADANSPTNFTLFCDTYPRVLNHYRDPLPGTAPGIVESVLGQYCSVLGKSVPCVNSMCVLRTPATVAVGATLNVPINDSLKSFLRALNKTNVQLCNSVSSTSAGFNLCGENVWYNPQLQAVILLPTGSLAPPPAGIAAKITAPLASMSSYVMSVLHDPANLAMNFAYFPRTRLFNHLYAAQNGNRAVFGFLEEKLKPEYDPVPLDYIGVRYTGIGLGPNPCLDYVKRYDSRAFCENQTGTGFNIIARHRCEPTQPNCQGASPIVSVWPALTGKLRP